MKQLNGRCAEKKSQSRRAAKVAKTRKQIITAARAVFIRHPFVAAGIRLIEEAGGFNHSSIYYHFNTKSELFKEVVSELYQEYLDVSREILGGLGQKPLKEDLSEAIDRLLDFGFKKPDILKVMMLNIGETVNIDEMTDGFYYFRKYNETIYSLFSLNKAFRATRKQVTMWIAAFQIVIANYLGSPALFRQALCMDSDETVYRRFIKESLMLIFYPPLKALLFPDLHPPRQSFGGKRKKIQAINSGKYLAAKGPPPSTKGDISRARILEVARSIFGRTPYNAASIRMIGEAGDFDFTLLYHYFPTKADLFEAVMGEIFEELSFFVKHITIEMNDESMQGSLSFLIESVVDYFWTHPQGFSVCMQNVAQVNNLEDFPGTRHLLAIVTSTQEAYRLPDNQANDEVRGIIYGMGTIVINLLGASTFYGSILNIDPQSDRYKRWVKDMMIFISYPALKAHLTRWADLYSKDVLSTFSFNGPDHSEIR